jgi:hypothetical protein
MLGDGRAELAPADHDEIERPHVTAARQGIAVDVPRDGAIGRIRIGEGFVESVADVAPQHVESEVGWLRGRADNHGGLPKHEPRRKRGTPQQYFQCLRHDDLNKICILK